LGRAERPFFYLEGDVGRPKGYKASEESRARMSAAQKARWARTDPHVVQQAVLNQKQRKSSQVSPERALEIRMAAIDRAKAEGQVVLNEIGERYPDLPLLQDCIPGTWAPREVVTIWWLAMNPEDRPYSEAELTKKMGVSPFYVQREINRRGVYKAIQQARCFMLLQERDKLEKSVMQSALPHLGLDKDGNSVEMAGDPRSMEIWRKMDQQAREELNLTRDTEITVTGNEWEGADRAWKLTREREVLEVRERRGAVEVESE
jgi:hypothetical protein